MQNRNWHPAFLRNFPLGMACGLIFAFLFFAIVTGLNHDWLGKFWVYLVSALVTLIAAGVALSAQLSAQRLQIEISEQQRTRKLFAAKSLLPFALSELLNIAHSGGQRAFEEMSQYRAPALSTEEAGLELSDESTERIVRVIQYANSDDAAYFAHILATHQILKSRFNQMNNDEGFTAMPLTTSAYADRCVSWAYFLALINSGFDYSRGAPRVENQPDEKSILQSLENLHFTLPFFERKKRFPDLPEQQQEKASYYAETFRKRLESKD